MMRLLEGQTSGLPDNFYINGSGPAGPWGITQPWVTYLNTPKLGRNWNIYRVSLSFFGLYRMTASIDTEEAIDFTVQTFLNQLPISEKVTQRLYLPVQIPANFDLPLYQWPVTYTPSAFASMPFSPEFPTMHINPAIALDCRSGDQIRIELMLKFLGGVDPSGPDGSPSFIDEFTFNVNAQLLGENSPILLQRT